MSFGIYAIQFYVQSSLPLLCRFLLVSLCYIPIIEGMNTQKIIDENRNQKQRINDAIINRLAVAFTDGRNGIWCFIGLQRCETNKTCAVSPGVAVIVLDIFEPPADTAARIVIKHLMKLQNIVWGQRNILIALVDGIQHISIAADFLFIPISRGV